MTYRRSYLTLLLFATVLWLTGCGGSTRPASGDGNLWFVHVSDPHIFLSTAHTLPSKELSDDKAKAESETGKRQELQGEKTWLDMLEAISALPEPTPPAFLLLTGDLGLDPCPIVKGAATVKDCIAPSDPERQGQIEKIAALMEKSSVRDIYLVAGNNDIALEDSGDAALGYFNEFLDRVQDKIRDDKGKVRLHNLTRCYVSGAASASCSADISDTPYRMIGLPSYSFKKADADPNNSPQTRHLAVFRGLMEKARQDGKQVFVVTHIPEIDDPFKLGQSAYGPGPADPPGSIWKVRQLDDWKSLLASDTVAAVFAGHLHDSHRENYIQPYAWSSLADHDAAFRKLFIAPPLSVKNQDGSPIQARGFLLVDLDRGQISSTPYWYDPRTGHFAHAEHSKSHQLERAAGWRGVIQWLWRLDHKDTAVERLAVLLIAILAAFLTIVAVWQIPPPDTSLTSKAPADKAPTPTPTPFTTKLGMTVVGGLGGLVAAEVTKTLGSQTPSEEVKWFYLVWFVLSFFILLVGLNLIRSLVEAVRARVALRYYSLAQQRHENYGYYLWLRFLHWFYSLRIPLLTFFDTFINLIQGKNQTNSEVFAAEIVDQQRNVVRTADAIRKDLTNLIERRVIELRGAGADVPQVRVNISVLSADQSSVFYISRSPGSSRQSFSKKSMAWVCVLAGELRWYQSEFARHKIVLLDNCDGTIPEEKCKIMLGTHYEPRAGEDYEAFVMLPIPWPHRQFGTDYVKGAIHISFRTDDDFAAIWDDYPLVHLPDEDPQAWYYPKPARMLEDLCDPETRAGLLTALAALGELLRGFNETIYKNSIDPHQPD